MRSVGKAEAEVGPGVDEPARRTDRALLMEAGNQYAKQYLHRVSLSCRKILTFILAVKASIRVCTSPGVSERLKGNNKELNSYVRMKQSRILQAFAEMSPSPLQNRGGA